MSGSPIWVWSLASSVQITQLPQNFPCLTLTLKSKETGKNQQKNSTQPLAIDDKYIRIEEFTSQTLSGDFGYENQATRRHQV